jgi:hypothetical protein
MCTMREENRRVKTSLCTCGEMISTGMQNRELTKTIWLRWKGLPGRRFRGFHNFATTSGLHQTRALTDF